MSTEVEGYSVKEDDKYVSYSMVENEWSKTEMDESEVDVLNDSMFDGFKRCGRRVLNCRRI